MEQGYSGPPLALCAVVGPAVASLSGPSHHCPPCVIVPLRCPPSCRRCLLTVVSCPLSRCHAPCVMPLAVSCPLSWCLAPSHSVVPTRSVVPACDVMPTRGVVPPRGGVVPPRGDVVPPHGDVVPPCGSVMPPLVVSMPASACVGPCAVSLGLSCGGWALHGIVGPYPSLLGLTQPYTPLWGPSRHC